MEAAIRGTAPVPCSSSFTGPVSRQTWRGNGYASVVVEGRSIRPYEEAHPRKHLAAYAAHRRLLERLIGEAAKAIQLHLELITGKQVKHHHRAEYLVLTMATRVIACPAVLS